MQAYQYDSKTKIYSGVITCQLDPLESETQGKEVWLLPADSTWKEPLPTKEGFNVVWNGNEWVYDAIPLPPSPPEPTEDEMKKQVREIRSGYLGATDYTQLSDAPFTEEEKAEYREYRQYLRDYTDQQDWWLHNPDDFETWRSK